jgi:hypothetical protein
MVKAFDPMEPFIRPFVRVLDKMEGKSEENFRDWGKLSAGNEGGARKYKTLFTTSP